MTLQGDMLPLFSLWLVNKAEYTREVNTSESSVLVKSLLINISEILSTANRKMFIEYIEKISFTVGKLLFFYVSLRFLLQAGVPSHWTASLCCRSQLKPISSLHPYPLLLPSPPLTITDAYEAAAETLEHAGKCQMSYLCVYTDSFITYSFCRHLMQYSYFYSPSE